jgi:DNA-binding NarL/FixJ family response regulator
MNSTKQITVLLADDHASVRHGLRTLLVRDERIEVVDEAHNGQEAVDMALKLRPNVILMDVSMPLVNGLEATRQIMAKRPSAKIILLSAHIDDEYVKRARQVGAVGYIAKQMSAETLASAVREAAMGGTLYNPVKSATPFREEAKRQGRIGAAKDERGHLSSRESELLQLVGEGSRKRQIAAKLCVSLATAESLLEGLMSKLDIPQIGSLAAYAVASGNVENDVVLTIT